MSMWEYEQKVEAGRLAREQSYRHYGELQEQLPEYILLLASGEGWYEAFGRSAIVVAEVCDLPLATTAVIDGERRQNTGIPPRRVDSAIVELTREGWKVALAERIDRDYGGSRFA